MTQTSPDNVNKRALKAGSFYVVTQVFVRGLTFLLTPVYTRLVSTEQYGQIRIYESWLLIFIPIMALGLYRGVERAKYDYGERYDEYISSTSFLTFLSTAAFFVLFLVFYRPVSSFLNLDPLLFAIMFLYVLTYTATLFFMQREKQNMEYKRMALYTVCTMVPAVFLSILLLWWGNRTGRTAQLVDLRMIGYYGPQIIGGLILIFFLWRRGRVLTGKEYWKYGLLYSLPLVPNQLSLQIMNQSDKIMVGKMTGDANAGIFALATTISFIMWVVLESVWEAWIPWLYTKISLGKKKEAVKPWYVTAGLFGLLALVLVLTAPELVLILGGEKYAQAAYLVAPMVLGVLYRFVSQIYSAMQNYEKKTYYVAAGTIGAMVLNVILNYVCILKFGYQAAAYTTAFSYFMLLLIQGFLEKKVTGERLVPLRMMVGFSLICGVVCFAVMRFFPAHWLIRWGIAAVLGCAALVLLLKAGLLEMFRKERS